MPIRQPNQGLPVYAKNEAGWDAPNHMIQLHVAYACEDIPSHDTFTDFSALYKQNILN